MYQFDMAALTDHLRRQVEQNRVASYFNIDILKYQVRLHLFRKAHSSIRHSQNDFHILFIVYQPSVQMKTKDVSMGKEKRFTRNTLTILLQVKTSACMSAIPLHLLCYWKCESGQTDFRLDYRYNRTQRAPLSSINVLVPVDGDVTHMQSKPTATW